MRSPRDLLMSAERAALMEAPRPRRSLPLVEGFAPVVEPGAGARTPLASSARRIDRILRPNYAVWELTLACDLACRHCGSRAGRPRKGELTTPEAVDLVKQLSELGVKEVALIGGEAYLYPGWLTVIQEIRRAICATGNARSSGGTVPAATTPTNAAPAAPG